MTDNKATKFVELHLIQNFAPSCLNRDDTNTPKDCVFGGYRRARISSQCFKRAIRNNEIFEETLEQGIGCRTKGLIGKVVASLLAEGKEQEESHTITSAIVEAFMSKLDKEKTKVLLYLGDDEIIRIKDLILVNWEQLAQAATQAGDEQVKKKGKKEKKSPLLELCETLKKNYKTGTKAADIALFGRMMAESPKMNIDAASQVAHAISTHKVAMEMDFFTAVDDLQKDGETGSGMMGMTGFNSSCFYRYLLVDIKQLQKNLHNDQELTRKTVEAFLRAAVQAIPTGKQTAMAAHNPPSLVMAVVRDYGAPLSLANAFEKPVSAWEKKSLVESSVEALDAYWGEMCGMYGEKGIVSRPVCFSGELQNLNPKKDNFQAVVEDVMEKLALTKEG